MIGLADELLLGDFARKRVTTEYGPFQFSAFALDAREEPRGQGRGSLESFDFESDDQQRLLDGVVIVAGSAVLVPGCQSPANGLVATMRSVPTASAPIGA